jgi:hypothetical protein
VLDPATIDDTLTLEEANALVEDSKAEDTTKLEVAAEGIEEENPCMLDSRAVEDSPIVEETET